MSFSVAICIKMSMEQAYFDKNVIESGVFREKKLVAAARL
jgi:hypothetical protein